ncbi:unnamed protein product [Cylicocyclus nassatus]|uniref:Uncharacterized protein n=1 Tax=Cylicocyclus nassatus TaxID=53992 RepID=A0AA36DLU5_CYLNA|nr:unnamed protein product [Cylicocyclus nassatus]
MSYKLVLLIVLLQVCAVCSTGCWDWIKGCFKDSSDDRREYMENYNRCKDQCKKAHPHRSHPKDKNNFNECLEKCMKRWNNRELEHNRRRRL